MTALKKYQKLESQGLWRDTPAAQRREVVVSFGDASLVLSDPRTDSALSHWSLPAVERLNPGQLPAIYAPAPDAPETLEIDDQEMIAALEAVHGAIIHARPRPGRLRAVLVLGGTALVLGTLALIGPDRLVDHTAGVVPEAARAEIGLQTLAAMTRITGQPCSGTPGVQALERLSQRLFGETSPWDIRIVPDGVQGSAHLPGHILLVSRRLIDGQAGPEALAGFALAEAMRGGRADPLEPLLHHAGLRASFGLLTSGSLDAGAVQGYGEVLLRQPAVRLDDEAVLARFRAVDVPTTPYAYAVDPSGETTLSLIEADPFRDGAPVPVMPGADWAAVQAICDG